MRRFPFWLVLIAVVASSFAWLGCTPARDSYKLSVVFTSDCKGYLEDCG